MDDFCRELDRVKYSRDVGQSLYNLLGVITDASSRNPDKPAVFEPGREPLTYGKLVDFITYMACRLSEAGIKRYDRVCLVASNGADMATAFLSVSAIAACAPLNPAYTLDEFKFYIGDLNAKAIIIKDGLETAAFEAARELGVRVLVMKSTDDKTAGVFDVEITAATRSKVLEYSYLEDAALVLHTSGTTGRPKIVPLSQTNLTVSACNIMKSLSLSTDDRCLNVMPLFHVHGLIGAVLTSLVSGGSVVCSQGFDADQFLSWVSEFSPSWYSAVPTIHQAVAAQAERVNNLQHSLRFIRSSSAALSPKVAEKVEAIFDVPVVEAYSMTEAAHQMTVNPLARGLPKLGSVGKAAFCEVAIMDDAGNLLPSGMSGEIVVRGKNVIIAYENNPKANSKSFTNGWFRTGDQGYLDREDYLFINGRIKEIINRGGEKVFPQEVDDVLLRFPGVRQAAVFATPHPSLGEDLAAVVVMEKGCVATEKELRLFTAKHVAAYKVPTKIFFVEDIPKGPTGKIQRVGLYEKLGKEAAAAKTSAFKDGIPQSPVEQFVEKAWLEVFTLPSISVWEDFFSLGGNSIQAMQIIARVRDKYGVNLYFSEFFEAPTIIEQAELILRKVNDEAKG